MEKTTAFLLLGLEPNSNPEEDVLELKIEEAIFAEASFFMRRVFIPQLVEPRIKKLKQLDEAAHAFGLGFSNTRDVLNFDAEKAHIDRVETIADLISAYSQYEMTIKLGLSNEENPAEIIELYREWRRVFFNFSAKYILLFDQLETDFSEKVSMTFTISQQTDYSTLKSELKREIYSESVYTEYLRLKKMTT